MCEEIYQGAGISRSVALRLLFYAVAVIALVGYNKLGKCL